MEQLQKILAYRFWIVAGLSPILAVIAWQWGAKEAKSQFEGRSGVLQTTFGQIKKLEQNKQQPNPKWKAAVDAVLSEAEKDKSATWRILYKQQKDLFQWPGKEIAEAVAALEPNQPEIPQEWRNYYYLRDYKVAFTALQNKLQQVRRNAVNPIVQISDDLLAPYKRDWNQPPTTVEVLNAQEDIWVLSLLLDVIAKVNADATESFNAPIQEVLELQIADQVKRSTTSSPLGGGIGGQGQGGLGGLGGQGQGQNQGQGGLTGKGGPPQLQQPGGAAETPDTSGRYTEADPSKPYKSMRFRMLLMMKHKEAPRLLVELINHPVPITITDFHMEGPDFIGQRNGAPDTKLPDIGRVEVVGTLKLFKEPPAPPRPPGAASAQPAAAQAGQTTAAPAAGDNAAAPAPAAAQAPSAAPAPKNPK